MMAWTISAARTLPRQPPPRAASRVSEMSPNQERLMAASAST